MLLSKLFSLALALSGSAVSAASIPETDYDVIVVGGGPAGLSALSGLSRVRRKTALFDSHEYRNDPTREMHDVIGNDGTVSLLPIHKTATYIPVRLTTL